GLLKARYIDLTDQVRRMPVALVVTIDQADVPDLLVALENRSQMRFQITQYHWTRAHGVSSGFTPALGSALPSASGDPRRDAAGPSAAAASVGGRGGAQIGGPSETATSGAPTTLENEQATVSLVDLTVYGIVNVYERPKDTTPPPGTPAVV